MSLLQALKRLKSPSRAGGTGSPIIEYRENRPSYQRVDDDAISTLRGHPGFEALLNKVSIQRAILETTLLSRVYHSPEEVASLKEGIYWLGFLQGEMERITEKSRRKFAPATDDELELYKKIYASIEAVGSPQD